MANKRLTRLFFAFLLTIGIGLSSCELIDGIDDGLTQDEIVEGLKEALRVGTDTATTRLMKTDGYYKNPDPLVFIPWPAEAQQAKTIYENYGNTISNLTGGQLLSTEDIIQRFNRAAEDAATDAAPIFVDAILNITIADGLSILNGADTAATHYLRVNTFNELRDLYTPTVTAAMERIQVQQIWAQSAGYYNNAVGIINNTPFASTIYPDALIGLQPINENISEYVVTEALDGLFIEVGKREGEIRNNAVARVTDILRRVFGQNN